MPRKLKGKNDVPEQCILPLHGIVSSPEADHDRTDPTLKRVVISTRPCHQHNMSRSRGTAGALQERGASCDDLVMFDASRSVHEFREQYWIHYSDP